MFKIFKKKGKDKVIDLTERRFPGTVVAGPAADLPYGKTSSSSASSYKGSSSEETSGLGFLGSLAGAGSDNKEDTSSMSTSDYSTYNSNDYSEDISSESIRKMQRMHRRIDSVMERLELLERKMERAENRLNI